MTPETKTEARERMDEKACTKCKKVLPLDAFGKDRRAKSGKQGRCRDCKNLQHKLGGYRKKWRARNPERNLEIQRDWRKRHPGEGAHAVSPEHRAAHKAVERALRQGVLVRPDRCEKCGKSCRPHGHHADYSKPLDVIWVCQPCHRLEHLNAKSA